MSFVIKLADGRTLRSAITCTMCGAPCNGDLWVSLDFPDDFVCAPCGEDNVELAGYLSYAKVESVTLVMTKK